MAGKYTISDTGGLEFRIFADHTSPAALDELPQQIHETITRALFPPGPIYEHTRTVNLTIPFPPLADHEDDVTLGFLTAAYLLWFRALGYSWALQHHLDAMGDLGPPQQNRKALR